MKKYYLILLRNIIKIKIFDDCFQNRLDTQIYETMPGA